MGTESLRKESADAPVVRVLRPSIESPQQPVSSSATPPTRRKRWYWIAIALIAAIASYGGVRMYLGPTVPAYIVQKETIVQTIVASGRVQTPLRVDIGAQVTGTVASIPVIEGQTVDAGQTLIILDGSEAKANVGAAQAAVNQARIRLQQISNVALPAARETLQRATLNTNNARRQFERIKELKNQALVSQSQFDDAENALKLAESDLRSAQLQVESNSPSGGDYQTAQSTLRQAQANLLSARARLDYMKIRAPEAGTLIARNVERGDVVQPGKALMVLSPLGTTQLVVQIDEKNLAQLRIGQNALASADAYPQQKFAAQVVYINPAVDADRGSVEVKLDVKDPPEYLRQDMTVSVDIEVAKHIDTTTVAINGVRDLNSNSPWVMKVTDGKAKRQPVKIGARGLGKVEIVQGLQANDVVLTSVGAVRAEGERVRAVLAKNGTAKNETPKIETPKIETGTRR